MTEKKFQVTEDPRRFLGLENDRKIFEIWLIGPYLTPFGGLSFSIERRMMNSDKVLILQSGGETNRNFYGRGRPAALPLPDGPI